MLNVWNLFNQKSIYFEHLHKLRALQMTQFALLTFLMVDKE